MKNFFKSKIFLNQFFSFFAIIFVMFLSISGVILTLTENAYKKQTLLIAEGYRTQASDTIERWTSNRIIDIKNQALHLSKLDDATLRSESVTNTIQQIIKTNNNYYDISISDEKGNVINSSEGALEVNLSDRSYFQAAISGKSNISDFIKSKKTDGVPIMAISEPIFVDNKPKYVISGYIRLIKFKELTESLSIGNLGHTYLINSEGNPITSSSYIENFIDGGKDKANETIKFKSSAVKKVLNKEDGTSIYKDFMGESVLGSYQWFDKLQLGLIVEFKETQVMKPLTELNKVVIVLGAFVTFIGLILAFWLSSRIIKPIGVLINATNNITEKNYQQPLSVKTDSELDILVNKFNHMQAAIRIREDLLEKTNSELRIQRAEAIQANVLKSQFLANMSHELRTPLNSIIGFTTRVLKKTDDILPSVQKENLTIVKNEAQHLLELINNLLDFSKIEAGKMDIHKENINLVKITSELHGMINNLKEGKSIEYREEFFNTEYIPLYSDRIKIKQILINILSNAFKYSETGIIKLSIRQLDGYYKISVEDQGVGISEQDIINIFDEFRQVDGSYTRKIGGTGLGLSITKRLVSMLNGTIEVTSEVNVGSCFTIVIPITSQDTKVSEEIPVNDEVGLQNKINVVCIDDDSNVQRLYKQYLDKKGYHIISLDGREDILKIITEVNPEIIILDIMLPNKDGWEILSDLKDNNQTKNIPVIMASVLNEKDLAYKMNADEFLVKPISQEELMSAIKNCINNNDDDIQVLIADDDENYLNLMGQFLKDASISYRLAKNGVEAIEIINNNKPNILLLDIMMPFKDGFDVLEEFSRRPEWDDISVIIVTAKHLSKKEKEHLHKRTNLIIEKSGVHIDGVMNIVLKRIKEKTN
ncbi:MAG: domain S-box [Bacillales bacterium]|jgi:signal transduction histidine kinase/DNA-binding response OmpR family regulator|nr:domain S-box [Bacillales bacterium]